MQILRLLDILAACPAEFIPYVSITRKGDLLEFNCPHPLRGKISTVAATIEGGIETLIGKIIYEIREEKKSIEDHVIKEKEKLEKLLKVIKNAQL
jgi:hypothetical protein